MAFIGITIKFSKLDRQHYRSSQVPCAESKLEVDNLHLRSLILGKSIFIKQFYPIHELIYYYGYYSSSSSSLTIRTIHVQLLQTNLIGISNLKAKNVMSSSMTYPDPSHMIYAIVISMTIIWVGASVRSVVL